MAQPDSHPLTPDHCNLCNKLLAEGTRNAEVIRKCRECGFPVEQAESDQKYILDTVYAIKRNFFPNNV